MTEGKERKDRVYTVTVVHTIGTKVSSEPSWSWLRPAIHDVERADYLGLDKCIPWVKLDIVCTQRVNSAVHPSFKFGLRRLARSSGSSSTSSKKKRAKFCIVLEKRQRARSARLSFISLRKAKYSNNELWDSLTRTKMEEKDGTHFCLNFMSWCYVVFPCRYPILYEILGLWAVELRTFFLWRVSK